MMAKGVCSIFMCTERVAAADRALGGSGGGGGSGRGGRTDGCYWLPVAAAGLARPDQGQHARPIAAVHGRAWAGAAD